MHKLVLIRHGESTWNLENRFTGWTDVDLTPTGVEQAKQAGRLLKAEGYDFDVAYTSVLKRATRTLWHTLDELDRTWLPVVHSWRLNERHYGGLQGLNKAETAKKYGVLADYSRYNLGELANRWTFYIGADGKILDIDRKVNPANSGADITARLKALNIPPAKK